MTLILWDRNHLHRAIDGSQNDHALRHRCSSTAQHGDDLAQLYLEAVGTRVRLRSDASGLALRNVINPESLRAHAGSSGYKNVWSDLGFLVTPC